MTKDKHTIFLIIGNGFSMNMIEKMGKENLIDLSNLFRMGDKVPYPSKKDECFLSKKYCPDLWMLGAKPTNSKDEASKLINNIITSMNAHSFYADDEERINGIKNTCYYKAYCQLVSYLKNLFIYYNGLIKDEDLEKYSEKTGFVKFIKDSIKEYNVRIITYNYDILLERLLRLNKIKFKIAGFEQLTKDDEIIIYKPHGSISFETKRKSNFVQYNLTRDPFDDAKTPIVDMEVIDNVEKDGSLINPIIPPSGDATRFNSGWHYTIEEKITECIETARDKDSLIIYGVSYGHVDRNEIDKILTTLPYKIDVKNINPYPSETFEMVIGSIFENYSQYKDFYMEV